MSHPMSLTPTKISEKQCNTTIEDVKKCFAGYMLKFVICKKNYICKKMSREVTRFHNFKYLRSFLATIHRTKQNMQIGRIFNIVNFNIS